MKKRFISIFVIVFVLVITKVQVFSETQKVQNKTKPQESVKPFIGLNTDGKERYGVKDSKGKVVIKPIFNQVMGFSEGKAMAMVFNNVYCLNTSGKILYKIKIDGLYERALDAAKYSCGRALISLLDRGVYLDEYGHIVTGGFDTSPYKEGFATKLVGNTLGFINVDGEEVFTNYGALGDFKQGIAKCLPKDIAETTYFRADSGEVDKIIEDSAVFIDTKGKVLIDNSKNKYKVIGDFQNGVAIIKQNNLYGFVKKDGNIIVKPKYKKVCMFSEGLAAVQISGKWGFINTKGQFAIKPQFEDVGVFKRDENGTGLEGVFSESLACVKTNGKYGYINKKGKIVIKPVYEGGVAFSEGLAAVFPYMKNEKDKQSVNYNKVLFINKNGAIKISLLDDAIEGIELKFTNGKINIVKKIGEWEGDENHAPRPVEDEYYIDKNGNVVSEYSIGEKYLDD